MSEVHGVILPPLEAVVAQLLEVLAQGERRLVFVGQILEGFYDTGVHVLLAHGYHELERRRIRIRWFRRHTSTQRMKNQPNLLVDNAVTIKGTGMVHWSF